MLMVAIQVIASDVAVSMGGAEGNFELSAFRPILISNYLHSALILADMCDHFMITALSPVIGYDKAAAISYHAIDHDLTLKQAALAKSVPEELYGNVVQPIALTRPGIADSKGAKNDYHSG
jgi:fumarate hydratase class II